MSTTEILQKEAKRVKIHTTLVKWIEISKDNRYLGRKLLDHHLSKKIGLGLECLGDTAFVCDGYDGLEDFFSDFRENPTIEQSEKLYDIAGEMADEIKEEQFNE